MRPHRRCVPSRKPFKGRHSHSQQSASLAALKPLEFHAMDLLLLVSVLAAVGVAYLVFLMLRFKGRAAFTRDMPNGEHTSTPSKAALNSSLIGLLSFHYSSYGGERASAYRPSRRACPSPCWRGKGAHSETFSLSVSCLQLTFSISPRGSTLVKSRPTCTTSSKSGRKNGKSVA